jgi:membrane protein involved in colicin uptake
MEAWGEEVEARFEGDWEDRMEAWGEEMEAWGEEVERIAEAGDIADFVVAAALSSADSGADMDAERALARAERWRERAERDAERIAERAAERALREQSREVERMEREAERALRNAEREIRKAEAKAEADRRRLSRKDYERSLTISNPKTNNSIQVNGRELRVDDLRKSLMAALRKDGLVSRNDKTATLRLDGKAMTVDGRRVATKEVLRYAGLIEDAGLPVTGPMKIDLSPDSVGISFSAGAERNRVTYGRYDHSDK